MADGGPHLETYLAECRQLVVDEIRRLFAGSGEQHHLALYDLVLDYPLREGKALRPALSIALCCGLGGSLEGVLPTAATLELYHNAFLIHDDIEDESLVRRGDATLHRSHGVPVAVNVGDAMLCLSLQPLLDNVEVIGLGPALKILRCIARMTKESVEGQALELDWVRRNRWDLTDDDYIGMVVQKTGWYSFITPMLAGLLAAGRPQAPAELTELGRTLSIAFQITDDVLNLDGDLDEYGKEIGGDLWEGKRTLILIHAVRTAPAADRRRATAILGRRRPDPDREHDNALYDDLVATGHLTAEGRERLRRSPVASKTLDDVRFLERLIRDQRSLGHARAVAARHADAAAAVLDELTWLPESRHRQVLEELVVFVHQRSR